MFNNVNSSSKAVSFRALAIDIKRLESTLPCLHNKIQRVNDTGLLKTKSFGDFLVKQGDAINYTHRGKSFTLKDRILLVSQKPDPAKTEQALESRLFFSKKVPCAYLDDSHLVDVTK